LIKGMLGFRIHASQNARRVAEFQACIPQ
jgi:hypothetical protein